MFVPTTRMLWWFGSIVLPLSVVAGIVPGVRAVTLGAIGVFFLVLLLDLFNGIRYRGGIELRFPAFERLVCYRKGEIEFHARNRLNEQQTVRIGLPAPREMITQPDLFELTLPAADKWQEFFWDCLSEKRGDTELNECHLELSSPLGFWNIRETIDIDMKIRVYPNLHKERKNVSALFLKKGLPGLHTRRQIGKGRDFEKLRKYVPGDSFQDIYWKQTAKRNRPITREYQIEQTQKMYVVLDTSRLSGRETNLPDRSGFSMELSSGNRDENDWNVEFPEKTSVLERYIVASLVLFAAAERQGDHFGLITFDSTIRNFVPAGGGKEHYSSCRDTIYNVRTRSVNPDFSDVFTFIRTRLGSRSLVLFLTDLNDPVISEQFVEHIGVVSGHHLVLTAMMDWPGTGPLFQNSEVEDAADLYDELVHHLRWREMEQLSRKLRTRGVDFRRIRNEHLCPELINEYVNIKQRQVL